MRAPAKALISFVLGVCGGCSPPPNAAECEALLERYTGMLVKEENPDILPEDVRLLQQAARSTAKHDARFEFDACADKISRRQYDCAMSAPNVDSVERCLTL